MMTTPKVGQGEHPGAAAGKASIVQGPSALAVGAAAILCALALGCSRQNKSKNHRGGTETQNASAPATPEAGEAGAAAANNAAAAEADQEVEAAALVAEFAWELKDVPACHDKRDGREVFVWRLQRAFKCDKSTGKWL